MSRTRTVRRSWPRRRAPGTHRPSDPRTAIRPPYHDRAPPVPATLRARRPVGSRSKARYRATRRRPPPSHSNRNPPTTASARGWHSTSSKGNKAPRHSCTCRPSDGKSRPECRACRKDPCRTSASRRHPSTASLHEAPGRSRRRPMPGSIPPGRRFRYRR